MYRDLTKSSITKGLVFAVTLVLNVAVYAFIDPILRFLQIPTQLYASMREYLMIIFAGLIATSLYNFLSCLLRAVGNSVTPLWFLGISTVLNIDLDLLFVLVFTGELQVLLLLPFLHSMFPVLVCYFSLFFVVKSYFLKKSIFNGIKKF